MNDITTFRSGASWLVLCLLGTLALPAGTDVDNSSAAPMPRADMTARCRMHGTVLDESGTPLRATWLRWTARFGPQVLSGHVQTDGSGAVAIVLEGALQEGELGRLELTRGRPSYRLQVTKPARSLARTTLPLDLPRGDFALGRLRLELLPLVLSGRVLDDRGKAVADATVECEIREAGSTLPTRVSVRTDRTTGRFELRHANPVTLETVRIKKRGHLTHRRTIAAGTSGMEFLLPRAATLRGSFTEVRGVLKIELTTSDGAVHRQPYMIGSKDGRVRYRFADVAPGKARLIARSGERIVLDTSVELLRGEVSAPDSLREIPAR